MATTTLVDVTLGIRNMGNRTDFAGAAATDLSAEEDRFSQIILAEGWLKPADSFKPVAGAAASMDVVLGSGSAKSDYYLVEGDDAGQGNYVVRLEAATEDITLDAADASLARKDEIYLVVQDDPYDSSSRGLPVIGYRKGTAAGSPTVPGPDAAWDAYALIAEILVPGAAADILACTITDKRVPAVLGAGGLTLDSDTPSAIGVDNSEGSAATMARSDHIHEITNMQTIGVLADAATNVTGGVLAGYTTEATLSFTLPTGWTSALLIIDGRANAQLNGVATGDGIRAKINLTTEESDEFDATTGGSDSGSASVAFVYKTTLTASKTIDLDVKRVGDTGTVTLETASLSYTAIRVS